MDQIKTCFERSEKKRKPSAGEFERRLHLAERLRRQIGQERSVRCSKMPSDGIKRCSDMRLKGNLLTMMMRTMKSMILPHNLVAERLRSSTI